MSSVCMGLIEDPGRLYLWMRSKAELKFWRVNRSEKKMTAQLAGVEVEEEARLRRRMVQRRDR